MQGDEGGDVDFELPDYGGRKGRVVERAHELKSGVKLSTWVTTRYLSPRQDEALNHAEAERDLLLGAWARGYNAVFLQQLTEKKTPHTLHTLHTPCKEGNLS